MSEGSDCGDENLVLSLTVHGVPQTGAWGGAGKGRRKREALGNAAALSHHPRTLELRGASGYTSKVLRFHS